MKSILDQLREMTVVVADTGQRQAVQTYKPIDCTTNPSLVLAAFRDASYAELVEKEIVAGRKAGWTSEQVADALTVALGAELALLVPGRVSTEVDARLSFDTAASVRRARGIVEDYASRGIDRRRILIKLAATWEGIQAARILQDEGIDCNLTLLFSLCQAIACADAGAYLISPFVGRITDWHKRAEGRDSFPADEDRGVLSVRRIYDYYKSNEIKTIVMGASFRNVGQIKALAGCDNLTISPSLLDQLSSEQGVLERRLSPGNTNSMEAIPMDEATFRWDLNADAMATEKLAEGIRNFNTDNRLLVDIISDHMR